MKKVTLIIVLVLVIGGTISWQILFDESKQAYCTQEAKLCPDGLYVSRIGPDCRFAECPSENNETSSNFGNNQIEKAIINYLLTQKRFGWKTTNNSHNFCVIENLKPEKELFSLYVWVYCGEYIIQDSKLKTLSGSSGPAKINYPNELSFYDLSKFSYEVPGDGSHYAEDVGKIFPEDVQQGIFNFDRKNIIKRIESIAFANIFSWELIKQVIDNCEVKSVWQKHDRTVKIDLKNGEELFATEPKIDDIINITETVQSKCGEILMGTE